MSAGEAASRWRMPNDYQCDYGGDAGDFGLEDMDGAMVWEA